MISRLTRFVLEEEVYPRVHLAAGLYYSISKMVHYARLLTGFLVGISLLGFDLGKLTILAGAFGVGLGFGACGATGGSLTFEVRAWTSRFEDWSRIRSDLALAIRSTLTANHRALK